VAAVIVAATVAGVWWVPRGGAARRPVGGWLRHPGTWLAAVIAAFFVNQVLFTAYVAQVWHGDTACTGSSQGARRLNGWPHPL
jgi:hypothetical protein